VNSRSIVSNGIHSARRLVAIVAVAAGVGGFVAPPAIANGPTSRAYDETGMRDVLSVAAAMPTAIVPTTTTRALTRSPQARARAHSTRQRATTAAALSPIAMPTEHIARAAVVPFDARDAEMLVLGALALAACGAALVTAGIQRQRRDPDRYDGL
jgi:hypothetical protein